MRRALPLANMVMLMLLRRMGRGDLTAYGFRSTFNQTFKIDAGFEPKLLHSVRGVGYVIKVPA